MLIEQRTENPCVGGSIPPLGTISLLLLATTQLAGQTHVLESVCC